MKRNPVPATSHRRLPLAALVMGLLGFLLGGSAQGAPLGKLMAAAGNGSQSLSEVIQDVKVSPQQMESIRLGTLDAKERKALAGGVFSRYLSDHMKAISAPEEKAKNFVKGVVKDFTRYVPSFRVEATEGDEARVTLLLSIPLLIAELERQGLKEGHAITASAPNSSAAGNAAPPGPDSPAKARPTGGMFPYTALLVDERNREMHVVPQEAVAGFAVDNALPDAAGYKYKPAAQIKAVAPSESDLNSQVSPLATRAAQFSNKILFHIQDKSLVFKPEWSKQILSFLETSARVAKDRGESRAWPAVLPWTLSTLAANPGLVVVFGVRSDDKAGVLERIEIVGNQGGKFLRHYWSRQMHDPAYQETASRALEKAAAAFARLHRVKRPEALAPNLAFWIDKRVPDRDVVAVEGVLRTFALGEDSLLVPTEVTKDDVRYGSPVAGARAEKVLERIRKGVPGVAAKLASGEPPVILLAPQLGVTPTP